MNKFAVFDIDGTVYREAMSFIVAEELITRYDFKDEALLLAQARHTYKARGSTEAYWTYNKTMLEICEAVIPRVTPAELVATIDSLLAAKQEYCYAYTMQLLKTLKKEGRTLIAISGSIRDIIEPFSKAIGFDIVIASELEIVDKRFTGKRASQTKQGKDEVLKKIVNDYKLSFVDSIGVGDTHRDITMLASTEQAIAFNPNAALYEEAAERGWDIVLERKNMVYELAAKDDAYIVENAHPIFADSHQEHLR